MALVAGLGARRSYIPVGHVTCFLVCTARRYDATRSSGLEPRWAGSMGGFIFRNPGTCFFLVVGALMNIGSRLNDAYTFVNAGLPHQVYEGVGAAVFFITIVVLLYRWDRERLAPGKDEEKNAANEEKPVVTRFATAMPMEVGKSEPSSAVAPLLNGIRISIVGDPNGFGPPIGTLTFTATVRGSFSRLRIFLDFAERHVVFGKIGPKRIPIIEISDTYPGQEIAAVLGGIVLAMSPEGWWGPSPDTKLRMGLENGMNLEAQASVLILGPDDEQKQRFDFLVIQPRCRSDRSVTDANDLIRILTRDAFDFADQWEPAK